MCVAMRDQSKAVLNTKLQVEQSSRIQGVRYAVIMDGCAMLLSVHWPTSDTVEDYIINLMGTIKYHLERVKNTQFEVGSWQVAAFDGLCFVGQVCHGELNGSVLSTTCIRLYVV